MHSVAEAQALILQHARPLPPEPTSLSPAVLGRVLAEDVASDLDSPPHDKALMDGYAVRAADLPGGRGALRVIEEVVAGQTPRHPLGPGEACRIMTGAPLPAGADAVVMVERTRARDDRVEVDDRPPRPGQNVLRQGREMRAGETVLHAGAVLRPQELGLLATLGRTEARLVPAPRAAVLTTGDEVVEPTATPGPGQIRNSNGAMLTAQCARAGAVPRYLGIAPDRLDGLMALILQGLEADVLVLSGGVSAGQRDLTPDALRELRVTPHLHKVAMKPGKPAYFGTLDRGAARTLVFGLPGNPVSSFVCFELFVRPALRRLAGHDDAGPRAVSAALAEEFPYNTDRPTYHPARLEPSDGGGWRVAPVPWFGSADLRGLSRANALLVLPAGEHTHRAGQKCAVLPLEF